MSHTQNAQHRMEVLMAMFLQFVSIDFDQTRPWKTVMTLLLISFLLEQHPFPLEQHWQKTHDIAFPAQLQPQALSDWQIAFFSPSTILCSQADSLHCTWHCLLAQFLFSSVSGHIWLSLQNPWQHLFSKLDQQGVAPDMVHWAQCWWWLASTGYPSSPACSRWGCPGPAGWSSSYRHWAGRCACRTCGSRRTGSGRHCPWSGGWPVELCRWGGGGLMSRWTHTTLDLVWWVKNIWIRIQGNPHPPYPFHCDNPHQNNHQTI